MDTSFLKDLSAAEVRENLIHHIQGINKHLTKEYLEGLSDEELCGEAHPAYRNDYEKALNAKPKTYQPRILKNNS